MLRPPFLARVSLGLAATAVETAAAIPGRALGAVASLPTFPVKVAGNLVQSYLHAGQTLTGLAVKGDAVIDTVFPARSDHPEWVTFDEDLADGRDGHPGGGIPGAGTTGSGPGQDVPTGRVTRRDS